jgi:mono/diheme cytochrome c family protein
MSLRKLFRVLAGLSGTVIVCVVLLAAYASHQASRSWEVPFPNIVADRSPAGVARGAVIFGASCESCHKQPGATRAAGARLAEAPEWLGPLYAPNLTADPRVGIGSLPDATIARMVRFGINQRGQVGQMPSYAMSDADLAAVIGFVRSDAPLFRADATPLPRSQLSLAGKLALLLGGMLSPPARPSETIEAPAAAATPSYGRYLAEAVYQCGDCHTAGMAPDRLRAPGAYAGGVEMLDAQGQTVLTPNLTRDEATGIGRWTRDDLARALRERVRPDRSTIGAPMPSFRDLPDQEIDALFAFLRSLPPTRSTP